MRRTRLGWVVLAVTGALVAVGTGRLTLVTCGGGFRGDVKSYTDDVAVTAVPVGAP